MNEAREGCSCVTMSNRLYVLGGNCRNVPLQTVEYFDVKIGRWKYAQAMLSRRSGLTAVAVPHQRQILVVGGWDGSAVLASAELYHEDTDQWETLPAMSVARMYAAAAGPCRG
jgi:hypothetical protein